MDYFYKKSIDEFYKREGLIEVKMYESPIGSATTTDIIILHEYKEKIYASSACYICSIKELRNDLYDMFINQKVLDKKGEISDYLELNKIGENYTQNEKNFLTIFIEAQLYNLSKIYNGSYNRQDYEIKNIIKDKLEKRVRPSEILKELKEKCNIK